MYNSTYICIMHLHHQCMQFAAVGIDIYNSQNLKSMLPVYWPRLGHYMHARNTYTMSCTIMYIDSHMYEVLKVKINFPIENYSITCMLINFIHIY